MNEVRYLLDNNALGRMTPEQRAMPFVKEACRVPAEVLYEARGFPDIETLKELEYPTSASVLLAVQQIMRLVEPDDMGLVNLYDNLGYADPLLIACALDAARETDQYLFGPTWTIVTNDRAVRTMADRVGVPSMDSQAFAEVIALAHDDS